MLGQHIIVDFYGVNRDLLDDNEALAAIMQEAVAASGAHYLGHKFEPQSCSGVILIADSHLAWHTWPEHGFISLDYYTYSGGNVDGVRALDVIQER